MRTSLLLVLSLMVWSSRAGAQAALGGPAPSVLFSNAASGPLRTASLTAPADSAHRDIRPTYWKEGALVGGLLGALGGAFLGAAICRNSEVADKNCTWSSVGGGLITGLVLAIPGALIGGQMHKDAAAE